MGNNKRYFKYFITITLVICSFYAFSSPDSLKILIPQKTELQKIELFFEISKIYFPTNPDSVILYATKGIEYTHKTGNDKYLPDFLQLIGYADYYKRDFSASLNHLKQALQIFENRNNKQKTSDVTAYIGIVYQDSYNYDKSLNYFYKALKLYNDFGDSLNISAINNNLGLLFYRTGDYNKALLYFNHSLEIAKRNNLLKSAAFTLNNLSLISKDKNESNKALMYLLESKDILSKINDKKSLVIALENIGETYLKLKNFKQSQIYFKEALELSVKLNNKINEASILHNIGKVNMLTDNLEKAKENFMLSETIIKQYPDIGVAKNIYLSFSKYYKTINDYKNALVYYKLYKQMNDSIFSQESIDKLTGLKVQYETGEIETENELLKQKNLIQNITIQKQNNIRNAFIAITIIITLLIILIFYMFWLKKKTNTFLMSKNKLITEQRKKLEEANITKDKFFSIIAHDLKNPFFNIKQYSKTLDDNKAANIIYKKEIISDLKTISDDTYSLLENLLIWANAQKGYLEINKQEIELLPLVKESIRPYKMSATEKEIEIHIDIPSGIKILADKYTISTVIGNLFYNAVKFTNRQGTITLNVKKENKETTISICDNGIGISPEKIQQLFKIGKNTSSYGTNNEKGTGLGLIICKEFVELNGGKINVESKENKGSTFIIILNSI